jgi:signal transduction histidine kinase
MKQKGNEIRSIAEAAVETGETGEGGRYLSRLSAPAEVPPASRAQERALAALQSISQHVAAATDVPDCLGRLSKTVARLVGAERCVFFLLDPGGRSISPQTEAFRVPAHLLRALPRIPCDPALRDRGGRVVYGEELFRSSPRHRGEHDHCHRLVQALGAHDAMGVAWKAGQRRLGALAVFDSPSPAGFSDEDAWVLRVASLGAGLVWQHKQAERELRGLKDRETEQLRSEARRMAELERVKTDFLNMASHELRGPVGVVRGYLSMVRDGDFGRIGDQLRAPMDMVTAKVDQIWRLVEQMVEAARREESRLPLRRERLDLRRVVATATEEMRPLAEAGHTLAVRLPDEPVPVMGDSGRLADVVAALLDNAIKYSPNGGAILCELEMLNGHGVLRVHDQGVGIAPGDLAKVFTRFGRIVTPENSHIPGTGLGLHRTLELVHMHQGEVSVDSLPGKGSTFRVRLPLYSRDA